MHNLALMPCIHCGLPTRGEANHGTMEECIEALVAETMRLRKAISDLTLDKLILQEAARGNF